MTFGKGGSGEHECGEGSGERRSRVCARREDRESRDDCLSVTEIVRSDLPPAMCVLPFVEL